LGEAPIEPRNTATDDRKPSLQPMIEAVLAKPATSDVIVAPAFPRCVC